MIQLEFDLYTDLQAIRPVAFCPVCGSEQYLPSLRCLRCERRMA